MTRSRSTVSKRSCLVCLVQFPCPACSSLTMVQAMNVRAALPSVPEIRSSASSFHYSLHLWSLRALSSWKPICRYRIATASSLITLLRQRFLSTAGQLFLKVISSFLTCLFFHHAPKKLDTESSSQSALFSAADANAHSFCQSQPPVTS